MSELTKEQEQLDRIRERLANRDRSSGADIWVISAYEADLLVSHLDAVQDAYEQMVELKQKYELQADSLRAALTAKEQQLQEAQDEIRRLTHCEKCGQSACKHLDEIGNVLELRSQLETARGALDIIADLDFFSYGFPVQVARTAKEALSTLNPSKEDR